MEEIWKNIEGYEGIYMISNLGRVLSLRKEEVVISKYRGTYKRIKKEKILKNTIFSNGYCVVCLFSNGVSKKFLVHKLVAKAFIPNEKGLKEIDHINTRRDDNRVDNLRWVTRSENHLNPITKKRHKRIALENNSISNITRITKRVIQMSLEYKYIKTFNSVTEAANSIDSHTTDISACCKNKRFSCKGYVWVYEDDYKKGNYKKNILNINASRTYAKTVIQYDKDRKLIRRWNSITEAANELKINGAHITQCCKGKERMAGGFIWEYMTAMNYED